MPNYEIVKRVEGGKPSASELGSGTPDGTKFLRDDGTWQVPPGGQGSGVSGPASSTANALARWNGAGGAALKNSSVTIDDTGTIIGVPSDASVVGADAISIQPNSSRAGRFRLILGNNPLEPGGGSQLHQTLGILYAQPDTVTNYFNPDVMFAVRDGSGNVASAYSMGSEGNWTNAGGFTLRRWYLWAYDGSRSLLMHQSSTPDWLNVGEDAADKGLRLNNYGQTISTDSDAEIAGIYSTGRFTKNDTNVRAFSQAQIKPTFNFGGSNTNTTVTVLDVDTVNTSLTGATIRLARLAFGGAERFRVDSGGLCTVTTLLTGNGSTSVAPLALGVGGSLKTTPSAGDIEADAHCLYATTDAGNRGVVAVKHIIRADASRALSNVNTEQAIFNSPANGRLTLETGAYQFELLLSVTAMSATSGNLAIDPLGAGTATCGTWLYSAVGQDNSTPANAGALSGNFTITQQSVASIVTAGTGTAMGVLCRGTFEVTGAGTLIPSLTLVTANAATVAAGSYFTCERIGSTTVASVGQWD